MMRMDFKEIRFWYPKTSRYLEIGGGLLIFLIGVLVWNFLSPAYSSWSMTVRHHENLLRQKKAETKVSKLFERKTLLRTDKSADFIQKFSGWVEQNRLSIQQLKSASDSEGLFLELTAAGSDEAVFHFLDQFNQASFLLKGLKIKLSWTDSNALELGLSVWVRRSVQGEFEGDFSERGLSMVFTQEESCSDPFHYQGWVSVVSPDSLKRLSNWVYQENSCGRRKFKVEDSHDGESVEDPDFLGNRPLLFRGKETGTP